MQHLDATPSTQVRTTFRDISLQAAQRALGRPEIKQIDLSGLVDGSSEASWTGSISSNLKSLRVASDLSLRASGENTAANVDSAKRVPVEGIIHLGGASVERPWETVLNANIIGCYNLFEAARRQGVAI